MTRKFLVVFGTRPEAIKLAPIINRLQKTGSVQCKICITAQHRQMLDQVLNLFKIEPDYDLNLMQENQELSYLTAAILQQGQNIIRQEKPDFVLVQGDTTTAFAAGLAAFYEQVPVAHIEAGLRTRNIYSPWPEEANRQFISCIASYHFAPTVEAANNLRAEQVATERIFITGNSVIDALLDTVKLIADNSQLKKSLQQRFGFIDRNKKMLLVTGHRRENFGAGFQQICTALKEIANRKELEIVYPVHLNPNVRKPVKQILGPVENIHLLEPEDYLPFVYLMNNSYFILTDSGGIQEEAPSLGKPVLVMRETTERPEGVAAGTAKLVGTSVPKIVSAAEKLLDDKGEYAMMSRCHNPFGDGTASEQIIERLLGGE